MTEFIVSIEITSKKASLDELSSKIGILHEDGSFDKGIVYQKRVSEYTVWKIFSNEDKYATLEEHCYNLFSKLSNTSLLKPGILPDDSELTLNIGLLYDSENATCSVKIPFKCLELMKEYKININISCYPCSK